MEFGLMLLGMKRDLQRMLALLASDFDGPAGSIPLERLLGKHHRLLAELRESGLTWEQISRLLAGAGVVHRNGLPFPPSHLRGVFGRQRRRQLQDRSRKSGGSYAAASSALPVPNVVHEPRRTATAAKLYPAPEVKVGNSPPAVDQHSVDGSAGPGGRHGRTSDQSDIAAAAGASRIGDRARVLALMRQSALARRASD